MMKRLCTLALLFLFTTASLSAQSYIELGGFVGFAGYQGDLTEDPIDFKESKYSFGAFVKYPYNNKLHLRGQVYYGRISGADANSTSKGLRNRDWSFTADLLEVSIAAEWVPFAKPRFNRVSEFRKQINPFLSLGVGATFGKDELKYQHSTQQPKFGYPEPGDVNNFLIIPIGAGLRFDLTPWTTFAGEFAFRYTQSDYVDGVSQNGLAAGPDWYFFIGLTLSTYFGEQENFGLD